MFGLVNRTTLLPYLCLQGKSADLTKYHLSATYYGLALKMKYEKCSKIFYTLAFTPTL